MDITDVRIKTVNNTKGSLVATASITLDNVFVIHEIKIINGSTGLFVAMPSRRNEKTGEYSDVAHPLDQNTRTLIEKAVLKEYQSILPYTIHEHREYVQ